MPQTLSVEIEHYYSQTEHLRQIYNETQTLLEHIRTEQLPTVCTTNPNTSDRTLLYVRSQFALLSLIIDIINRHVIGWPDTTYWFCIQHRHCCTSRVNCCT